MQDEELPWERRERLQKAAETEDLGLPFGVYLLASVLVAIAAVSRILCCEYCIVLGFNGTCNGMPMFPFLQVGSVFEIINKNPLFGIVQPSSPLWLPILGFFAVTGVPSAGDIIRHLQVPP